MRLNVALPVTSELPSKWKAPFSGALVLALALVARSDAPECDELGCDHNLCDAQHPCNRGCVCTYPPDAAVGYCRPWAMPNPHGDDDDDNVKRAVVYLHNRDS